MLNSCLKLVTAAVLVGAFAVQVQAAVPQQVNPEAGVKASNTRVKWQVAHKANWEHVHNCNPSPCKRLKDRHKKGLGTVFW